MGMPCMLAICCMKAIVTGTTVVAVSNDLQNVPTGGDMLGIVHLWMHLARNASIAERRAEFSTDERTQ